MSFKDILKEAKKGWDSAGIEWRETAIRHNVDPDKFLQLPQGEQMLAEAICLPRQGQVQFFNTVARKYPSLRYEG